MNIDLEKAIDQLKKNKIDINDGNETLQEIARKNKISPLRIYQVMKNGDRKNMKTG